MLVTVLTVVVVLLAILVAGLLRSHAEILRELHELGVDLDPDSTRTASRGVTVPRPRQQAEPRSAVDVAGTTPLGDAASVAVVGARHGTLLAFLTSGCSTCAEFWSAFADPGATRVPGDARLVVVTKGTDAESPARLRKFMPPDVPVIMSSEAWEAYDVPVAPYFAYVDGPSGVIVGEGAAATWTQLAGMMQQALDESGLAPRGRRRRRPAGRDAADRIDRELRDAGIEPGDASLYTGSDPDNGDPGTRG